MRIISLLPSATEIVYALGLGDSLVGVTHECDYPADARAKPVVTHGVLDCCDALPTEIDHAASTQLANDRALYQIDEALLQALQPDLILTQAVCAVPYDMVQGISARAGGIAPHVLSLEPSSLDAIFGTIQQVGSLAHADARAAAVVHALRCRVEQVRERAAQSVRRPRVACLEWIDPLYGSGHWLPELVHIAGGAVGLSVPGAAARPLAWSNVIAFAPEVIVIMPCGMDTGRATEEALHALPHRAGWDALPAVRAARVYVAAGNAYFSRPGPRIVDSLELLAELIHPELFTGAGPRDAWVPLPALITGRE